MINLKINSIVFTRIWLKEVPFYSRENTEHKVNIFCMKNGWWKTLLFTAINYILSWKEKSLFWKELSDICINISAKIDIDTFEFKKGYNFFKITKNWKKIDLSEYQNYIEQKLWIHEELIDKKGGITSQKNTPQSLFRFWFYSDNDIKLQNKWKLQSINLINTRFDWMWKKVLFAYYLWVNLTTKEYKQIKEYLYKKKYIDDNNALIKKNNKFIDEWNLFFDPKQSDKIYKNLSIWRRKLWDITVAIEKLTTIIDEYKQYKWEDANYTFLLSERTMLNQFKQTIQNKTKQEKTEFTQYSMFEKDHLSKGNIIEKDIEKIKLYYIFQKDIQNLEKTAIPEIISNVIDPELAKFKEFLDNKLSEYKLKDKFSTVYFDTNNLSISFIEWVSEWEAVLLRIVCSIFLNIYWLISEGSRWFNMICYDSIIEKIDDDNVYLFFDIVENIYKNEKAPNIFIFSTSKLKSRKSEVLNFDYKSILK